MIYRLNADSTVASKSTWRPDASADANVSRSVCWSVLAVAIKAAPLAIDVCRSPTPDSAGTARQWCRRVSAGRRTRSRRLWPYVTVQLVST